MADPQITPNQVAQARERLQTLHKLDAAIKPKLGSLQSHNGPVSTLTTSKTGTDAERVKAYQELNGICDEIFTPLRFAAGTKQPSVNKEIDRKTGKEGYRKELTDEDFKNSHLSTAQQKREKTLHKNYIEFADIQDWGIVAPDRMAQDTSFSLWTKFKQAPIASVGKAVVGVAKALSGYSILEAISRNLTDDPQTPKYKENLNMDLEAARLLDQEKQQCIAVLEKAGDHNDRALISSAKLIHFEDGIKSAQNILEEVDEHFFRRLKQLTESGYGKASMYDEKADHKFSFLKYFDSRGFFITPTRDAKGKPVVAIGEVPFYSASGRFHAAGALIGAYLDQLVLGSKYKAEINPDTGEIKKDAPTVLEHELAELNKEGGIHITQIPSGYPYEALAFLANAEVIAEQMGAKVHYDAESLMQNMSTRAWLIFNKEIHTNFNKYKATARRELDRHVIQKDTISSTKSVTTTSKYFGTQTKNVTTSTLKKEQGVSDKQITRERYMVHHSAETTPKPKETAAIQATTNTDDKVRTGAVQAEGFNEDRSQEETAALKANLENSTDQAKKDKAEEQTSKKSGPGQN